MIGLDQLIKRLETQLGRTARLATALRTLKAKTSTDPNSQAIKELEGELEALKLISNAASWTQTRKLFLSNLHPDIYATNNPKATEQDRKAAELICQKVTEIPHEQNNETDPLELRLQKQQIRKDEKRQTDITRLEEILKPESKANLEQLNYSLRQVLESDPQVDLDLYKARIYSTINRFYRANAKTEKHDNNRIELINLQKLTHIADDELAENCLVVDLTLSKVKDLLALAELNSSYESRSIFITQLNKIFQQIMQKLVRLTDLEDIPNLDLRIASKIYDKRKRVCPLNPDSRKLIEQYETKLAVTIKERTLTPMTIIQKGLIIGESKTLYHLLFNASSPEERNETRGYLTDISPQLKVFFK